MARIASYQVVVVFQAWFEAVAFSLPCASSSSPEVAAALDTFGGDGWEAVENILQGQRARGAVAVGMEEEGGWKEEHRRARAGQTLAEARGRVGVVTEAGDWEGGSSTRFAMGGGVEVGGVRGGGSSSKHPRVRGDVGVTAVEDSVGGSNKRVALEGGDVWVVTEVRAGGNTKHPAVGVGEGVGGPPDGQRGGVRSPTMMDVSGPSDTGVGGGEQPPTSSRMEIEGRGRLSPPPSRMVDLGRSSSSDVAGGGNQDQSTRKRDRWSREGTGTGDQPPRIRDVGRSHDGGGIFDQSARMAGVGRSYVGRINGDPSMEMDAGGRAEGIGYGGRTPPMEEAVGMGGVVGGGGGRGRRARVRVKDAPAKHRAISEFLRRVLAVAVGAADGQLVSAPEFLKSALFAEASNDCIRLRELGEAVGYYHEVSTACP